MNIKELKELLNKYPDNMLVGVHNYYDRLGGEMLELSDGVEEGFTDECDERVVYIY